MWDWNQEDVYTNINKEESSKNVNREEFSREDYYLSPALVKL